MKRSSLDNLFLNDNTETVKTTKLIQPVAKKVSKPLKSSILSLSVRKKLPITESFGRPFSLNLYRRYLKVKNLTIFKQEISNYMNTFKLFLTTFSQGLCVI